MAALTIRDLPASHELDPRAMSSVRGGGAPWVFGWIRPYFPDEGRPGAGGGFVQINNIYADQIINQIQVVEISNTGAGAAINVGLDQRGDNSKALPHR